MKNSRAWMPGEAVLSCPKILHRSTSSEFNLGLCQNQLLEWVGKSELDVARARTGCVLGCCFSRLGLHRSDGHSIDNVLRFAAAGEIICRLVESLEDWSDRSCAGQSFGELVSDVARLKIRED